jgi:glycosyltransferase involved in cell wall biosynthesis
MTTPLVNLTVPVLNEEAQLAESVGKLRAFLQDHAGFTWEIVIADNGSTDRTAQIAEELGRRWPEVRAVHLPLKGRGRALRKVWSESSAEILSYMDVDLSTDLSAFPRLIEPLANGEYDVATGSRLLPGSQTTRCWKRELISHAYNRLVRACFRTRFSDAQCGFKAITRKAAGELLPLVEDDAWFFDTELLVWAERRGYRILDLPVRWVEDADSRVKILRTSWQDLRGLLRLRRNLARNQAGSKWASSNSRAGP